MAGVCELCGKPRPPGARRWCGKKCNNRWRSTNRSSPFTCPACGSTVLIPIKKMGQQKYCTRSCATATFNRQNLVGPRNGRWRGGRALSYGPGWKEIKEQVRLRDQVCRTCGKTPERNGRALDVHHLRPYRFSGDNTLDNLVALCRSCHMRADDHGRRGSARFAGPVQLALRPLSQRELRRKRGEHQRRGRQELQSEAERLHARGLSLRRIARRLGVSHQTVANWLTAPTRRDGRVCEHPVPYRVSAA